MPATETAHDYLSTGCLHGEHDYCKSMTGYQGEKRPGRCKFCDAECRCHCHRAGNVRLSPDGFAAQLIRSPDGPDKWVLTYLEDYGIMIKLLDDPEVEGWAKLVVDPGPPERPPAPELSPQWRQHPTNEN